MTVGFSLTEPSCGTPGPDVDFSTPQEHGLAHMCDHINMEMERARRGEIAEPSMFVQELSLHRVSSCVDPGSQTHSSSLC